MITKDSVESKSIQQLRFILAVSIILMHCAIPYNSTIMDGNMAVFIGWSVIVKSLSQLAVPTFFFVSGYFFFTRHEYNHIQYKGKLKSRFKTLVLPYIVWNVLFYIFFAILGCLRGEFNISLEGFLKSFWSYYPVSHSTNIIGVDMIHNIVPIDGPLWFVRDLIICTIISPLLYLLINKKTLGGQFW